MPATASGADGILYPPRSPDQVPPGFHLSARQAFDKAEATQAVKAATKRFGRFAPSLYYGRQRWRIDYVKGGVERVELEIDGRTGALAGVWTGVDAQWDLARGSRSLLGARPAASLPVWLVLSVLFVLPFVDPRRPLRRTHLELAGLLAFAASFALWKRGSLEASQLIVFVLFLALIARFTIAGLRGRSPDEPLIPFASTRLLAGGAIALFIARVAFSLITSDTSDIGFGSLAGADRLLHGLDIYSRGGQIYDTYGPSTFIAYVPFAAIWPVKNLLELDPFGVHAAAIFFDGATAALLVVAGRRLVPGPSGRTAGIAAAYAWLAYPFTNLALAINSNDALVAFTVVLVVLTLRSPVLGGAWSAFAGLTKFAPLALASPLFGVVRRRGGRSAIVFVLVFSAVATVLIAVTLPDGGISEMYDTTIGFQGSRHSPFGIWSYVDVPALHTACSVAVVVFVASMAVVTPPRPPARFCALGAAAILATQLPLYYWFYLYLIWSLPLALLAVFLPTSKSMATASGRLHAR